MPSPYSCVCVNVPPSIHSIMYYVLWWIEAACLPPRSKRKWKWQWGLFLLFSLRFLLLLYSALLFLSSYPLPPTTTQLFSIFRMKWTKERTKKKKNPAPVLWSHDDNDNDNDEDPPLHDQSLHFTHHGCYIPAAAAAASSLPHPHQHPRRCISSPSISPCSCFLLLFFFQTATPSFFPVFSER